MWTFVAIVLFVVGVFLIYCSWCSDSFRSIAGVILCGIAVIIVIAEEFSKYRPTALDVYRGNTELRITSVNGVPTDTVVVFKNK